MSTKLKALGLGLFAMLAMGAFGVMNAGADGNGHTGGHFISNAPSGTTNIIGTEEHESQHNLVFAVDGDENAIDCTVSEYEGTTTGETVENVTITPEYDKCFTSSTTNESHTIEVTENECDFNFAVNTDPTTDHNAVDIEGCDPANPYFVIHHPNCEIRIPEQTVTGLLYTNVRDAEGNHEVTMDVETTGITAHFEAGLCVFLGTNHNAEMNGSVTVEGRDSVSGEKVDITATGPETTAAEKNE